MFFLLLHQKNVTVSVTVGAQPKVLTEFIQRHLPDLPEKEISMFAVFNQLPTKPKVEDLQKLHSRFNEKANIVAIFNKAFKVEQKISFPHVFPGNLRISLKTGTGITVPDHFFVILKGNKVDYLAFNSSMTEKAFLIQERLNPERGYQDYAVSIDRLKEKITRRIKRGGLKLLHLNGESGEIPVDLSGFSKVYFVHAACSTCQLKSIIQSVKLKDILDGSKSAVFFSVLANSFQLSPVFDANPINIPLYLDINDQFGLFSVITNDRQNPIEIDLTQTGDT